MLDNDERLILLHIRDNQLSLESLTRLGELGIKTAIPLRWTSWHEIEPQPGNFNWDILDRQIELYREAGMKILLPLYERAPDWLEPAINHVPPYGLIRETDSIWHLSYRDIDPLNGDALARELEFLEVMCERFTAEDISCIYAVPGCGDRVLPLHYGKPYTEQQCVDVVLARQDIFARYSNSLWAAWHPGMTRGWTSLNGHTKEKCGNEFIAECFAAMTDEFPDHTINRIAWQFFGAAPTGWAPGSGVDKGWVGAEYATGVAGHAGIIERFGIWGLVMEATKWQEGHRQPTDEEYYNVAQALETLRKYDE